MNKSEFIRELGIEADLSRQDAIAALDAFQAIVTRELQAGNNVTITNFVKFSKTDVPAKKARKGRNPFNGEEMMFKAKPATVRVRVSALKGFKESVATKRRVRRNIT